jgi:hypothetical protein
VLRETCAACVQRFPLEAVMTDRELLELAAKAAGYELTSYQDGIEFPCYSINKATRWNPLTDDGDALRLAVKRRFHINIFSATDGHGIDTPGFVEIWHDDADPIHTEYVTAGDYESATRRAIVRAAAEIGRTS